MDKEGRNLHYIAILVGDTFIIQLINLFPSNLNIIIVSTASFFLRFPFPLISENSIWQQCIFISFQFLNLLIKILNSHQICVPIVYEFVKWNHLKARFFFFVNYKVNKMKSHLKKISSKRIKILPVVNAWEQTSKSNQHFYL